MKRRDSRVGGIDPAANPAAASARIQAGLSLLSPESDFGPSEPNLLDINLIRPDPVQPRRAMPAALRLEWCSGSPLGPLFAEWEQDAASDLHRFEIDPDWRSWIDGSVEPPLDDLDPLPLQANTRQYLDLIRLAVSIHQIGLEVPITVYPVEGGLYRLQAGERRVLAFHALTLFSFAGYEVIPAIIRERYDPFRQAAENGVRQDLNAIGMARQLALLLFALHGFDPFHAEDSQQAGQSWYAGAAELRVPHGKAAAVANVMGLPNIRMVQLYRQLLLLPAPVWNWADQFNWTEGRIRGLVLKAHGDPEVLIELAQAEVNRELGNANRPAPTPADRTYKQVRTTHSAMGRIVSMSDEDLRYVTAEQRRVLIDQAMRLLRRLGVSDAS